MQYDGLLIVLHGHYGGPNILAHLTNFSFILEKPKLNLLPICYPCNSIEIPKLGSDIMSDQFSAEENIRL